MAKEWERYSLREAGYSELTTVHHIVHIPTARRIVEDGKIKAGLIYDESKLNTSRISVVWLSANSWHQGSLYGTVEFQFSWDALVEGKRFYWVEAIEKYNPTAYRILISREKLSSDLLQPYDPISDDGPLRFQDGVWRWNSQLCSEFMVVDDVSLRRATGLDFVLHHRDICRAFGPTCEDRQENPSLSRTGGQMLAYLVGHDIHRLDRHLKPSKDDPEARNDLLDIAFFGLKRALTRQTPFGGPLRRPRSCEPIVRGALALYGLDQLEAAGSLLSLLATQARFERTLKNIVRRHFDRPKWQPGN